MHKPQLFCFTYAGGTAAFFDGIEQHLSGIEVVKPEYAGHGKRHGEPFYRDFAGLADDMFTQFQTQYRGGAYGLFGYSMGSITVVEVLKRILAHGMQRPDHLFLAAHEPHPKAELLGFSADVPDGFIMERTVRFGAVPEKLIGNRVFWRTYLPLYRADYAIIQTYDFEKELIASDIPAAVFYSETDTPFADISLWERYFPCQFYRFDGTHFFIQQHYEEMAQIMKSKMG